MNNHAPWLSLVGINENGVEGLSESARACIASATLVAGAKRHLALAATLITGEALQWPSPPHYAIATLLARRPAPVCVLTSGDPFWYGMGAVLARSVPIEQIRAYPQPSIFSLVAARMGWALQHTVTIGLNGRPVEKIIPHLQPGARIIALSADETTPQKLAALLNARGFGASGLTVFEHAGGEKERIRSTTGADFTLDDIARLNCMAIAIPDTIEIKAHALPLTCGLDDAWFAHDGQLTKREVRAITLSALAPRCGELLWDIGLGAGSIAIEWLRCHPANRAIGFEKNPERADRAAKNAKTLGVPQLVVLEGSAPEVLEGLEPPDAIFIGGGAGTPGIIDYCRQILKPAGRLVINAVSLETESLLLAAYKHHGGNLTRIHLERADGLSATMTGWRAAMTVTQWSIIK